ncbi:MAG: hypothetical protein C0467_21220 [Planctomycetaceae bacterium]|nr:hypothetical protein [Planctomycetaceae bacterium]
MTTLSVDGPGYHGTLAISRDSHFENEPGGGVLSVAEMHSWISGKIKQRSELYFKRWGMMRFGEPPVLTGGWLAEPAH